MKISVSRSLCSLVLEEKSLSLHGKKYCREVRSCWTMNLKNTLKGGYGSQGGGGGPTRNLRKNGFNDKFGILRRRTTSRKRIIHFVLIPIELSWNINDEYFWKIILTTYWLILSALILIKFQILVTLRTLWIIYSL